MTTVETDVLLAQQGTIGAGPLAFLIIVLLLIVTALLVRNMNGRLRKLPQQFDEPPGDDAGLPPLR